MCITLHLSELKRSNQRSDQLLHERVKVFVESFMCESPNFGIIGKHTNVRLYPFWQVINEEQEQERSENWPLGESTKYSCPRRETTVYSNPHYLFCHPERPVSNLTSFLRMLFNFWISRSCGTVSRLSYSLGILRLDHILRQYYSSILRTPPTHW